MPLTSGTSAIQDFPKFYDTPRSWRIAVLIVRSISQTSYWAWAADSIAGTSQRTGLADLLMVSNEFYLQALRSFGAALGE